MAAGEIRIRTASRHMAGRDEELAALVRFAVCLRVGEPQVALVSGRAGMGKTRLVIEVADRLAELGVKVVLGACPAVGAAGTPYQPVLDALQNAFPHDLAIRPLSSPDGRPSRIREAVAVALARVSRRDPVLLVVEDLHWSNRPIRDLLAYLVGRPAGRWGLLGTFRYDGPLGHGELTRFADALERRPILRISLGTLNQEAVALQMAGIEGHRPAPERAANVHRRTGGIPLLVEEVLASRDDGVPDHLRSLFLHRLQVPGPMIVEVVRALAVVGEPADEALVAYATGRTEQEVRSAVETARRADLLSRDRVGYQLRHELLREIVYDDLPPALRRTLHGRIATYLGSRGSRSQAVLAHHWYEARQPNEAAKASIAAASEAERARDPAGALLHLERVLELWADVGEADQKTLGDYDEVLRRAARAAEQAGSFARAAILAEHRVALAPGDPLPWERLARYRWQAGDSAGAEAAYQAASDRLNADTPVQTRVSVMSGHAWFLGATYRLPAARTLSARALRLAVDAPPSTRWQALLAWGIARLGDEAANRALAEARDLASRTGNFTRVAVTTLWLNNSLQVLGRPVEREEALRSSLAQADRHELGLGSDQATRFMLAELLIETGRWDEAADHLHEIRGATGMTAVFAAALRARLASYRGDEVQLVTALEAGRALGSRAEQQPIPAAIADMAEAEFLLWKRKPHEAIRRAAHATELAADDHFYRAEALALLARAQADLAEESRRRSHGDEPVTLTAADIDRVDRPSHAHVHAMCLTASAELTRAAGLRDLRPWETAVAAWELTSDSYHLAYARWRLTWVLLGSRAGRAEARRQLRLVSETATSLDAQPLADAVAALHRTGRLEPLGSTAGMTARELEVLPLLTAGRTNAEIADVLVISSRTVGVHVSHILGKLGATRRTEAADIARRLGLVE